MSKSSPNTIFSLLSEFQGEVGAFLATHSNHIIVGTIVVVGLLAYLLVARSIVRRRASKQLEDKEGINGALDRMHRELDDSSRII